MKTKYLHIALLAGCAVFTATSVAAQEVIMRRPIPKLPGEVSTPDSVTPDPGPTPDPTADLPTDVVIDTTMCEEHGNGGEPYVSDPHWEFTDWTPETCAPGAVQTRDVTCTVTFICHNFGPEGYEITHEESRAVADELCTTGSPWSRYIYQ